MRRPLLITAAVALLAGCARPPVQTTPWQGTVTTGVAPPGVEAACRLEAARGAAGVNDLNAFVGAAQRAATERRLMDLCIQARTVNTTGGGGGGKAL
jgi:hypothetical protein